MKTMIGMLFVSVALMTMASARIGETEEEISARFGQSVGDIPTETFGKMRGFTWSGYVVGVAFVNGRSEMEMFSKTDQSEMLASEIEKLLKADGPEEWKAEPTGKPNWRRWRQPESGLVALYDTGRHFLYISSKQFYEKKKLEAGEDQPPK
jgi:hypothetical protein